MQAGKSTLRNQEGYVLVWLLAVIGLAGVGLAAIGELWSMDVQRERERELVRVGAQYAQAIASYYYASPINKREFPRSLEALTEDGRASPPRRHLRRLMTDPVSPGKPFALVQSSDGAITGVYSDSGERPVSRVDLEYGGTTLPAVKQYRDWKFNAKVNL